MTDTTRLSSDTCLAFPYNSRRTSHTFIKPLNYENTSISVNVAVTMTVVEILHWSIVLHSSIITIIRLVNFVLSRLVTEFNALRGANTFPRELCSVVDWLGGCVANTESIFCIT